MLPLWLLGDVGSDRYPLLQYLLERFIEAEAVPKAAAVYQPPDDKQRGVFRLVRSAAGSSTDSKPRYCCLVRRLGRAWRRARDVEKPHSAQALSAAVSCLIHLADHQAVAHERTTYILFWLSLLQAALPCSLYTSA